MMGDWEMSIGALLILSTTSLSAVPGLHRGMLIVDIIVVAR